MTQEEIDQLRHENLELISTLADKQICMMDIMGALEVVNNLLLLCLNHPNAPEHKEWRKGLLMALERVSKTLIQGMEIEE